MPIVYSYSKYRDVYSLSNQGISSFTYKLIKLSCSEESIIINNTTLNAGTNTNILLPSDGYYMLVLQQAEEDDIVIYIKDYNKLLNSFLEDAKNLLCDCKCKNCDCEDSLNSLLLTITKANIYYNLNTEELCSIYSCVNSYNSCSIEEESICLITNELLTGKSDVSHLVKNLVINFYLAFYFRELIFAINLEEVNYIKAKYFSDEILKCIKKLGIDIKNILCNPPLPSPSGCTEWIWSLVDQEGSLVVSAKYYDCNNKEQFIADTVENLSRTVSICTNGIEPSITVGTITNNGECIK